MYHAYCVGGLEQKYLHEIAVIRRICLFVCLKIDEQISQAVHSIVKLMVNVKRHFLEVTKKKHLKDKQKKDSFNLPFNKQHYSSSDSFKYSNKFYILNLRQKQKMFVAY